MNQFGEKIKYLRELNGFLQKDVASQMAIDAPMLSKIESGERNAKRKQVTILSKLFKMAEDELLSLWLADKLYETVKEEEIALLAIGILEKYLITENQKKTSKKNGRQ